jgi:hypothetical protein
VVQNETLSRSICFRNMKKIHRNKSCEYDCHDAKSPCAAKDMVSPDDGTAINGSKLEGRMHG